MVKRYHSVYLYIYISQAIANISSTAIIQMQTKLMCWYVVRKVPWFIIVGVFENWVSNLSHKVIWLVVVPLILTNDDTEWESEWEKEWTLTNWKTDWAVYKIYAFYSQLKRSVVAYHKQTTSILKNVYNFKLFW